MACGSVKCHVCGGSFPACQMKDGKCATCRAKEQQEKAQQAQVKK
jgi:hypothetical protein